MDLQAASRSVGRESSFVLFSIQERMNDLGNSLEIVSKPRGNRLVAWFILTSED